MWSFMDDYTIVNYVINAITFVVILYFYMGEIKTP